MNRIFISGLELYDLLSTNKKQYQWLLNMNELRFCIFAERVNNGSVFISIDSTKYSKTDGGLGFTNNEDSVFGLGGNINTMDKIDLAIKNNASIIIVDDIKHIRQNQSTRFILVDDCLQLIIDITKKYLSKSKAKVIAITGSTGKTTTTIALYNFLSVKYRVKRIHRIRNSVLGMCIDIIQNLCIDDDFLIVEMQLDAENQIKNFCNIAQPDYSIITAINLSHYSRFNSTESIIKEKTQIYDFMNKNGKCIINGDDENLINWSRSINNDKIYSIGINYNWSDIVVSNISAVGDYNLLNFNLNISKKDYGNFTISSPSKGTIYALLFSLYFAKECNYEYDDILKGISKIKSPLGRFQGFKGINNSFILLDSYNANYSSIKNGLEYFSSLSHKKKIVILGSMMELGVHTESEHKRVGEYISTNCDISHLITLGEAAFYIAINVHNVIPQNIHSFYEYEDILETLFEIGVDENTAIYIKGSGAMRMELIAPHILSEKIF